MNLVGQLGGDHQQAAQQLQGMGQVDSQQHAGLLNQLGVDPQQLENGGYQQHFDSQQQPGFAGYQSGGGSYADQQPTFDTSGRQGYGQQQGGGQEQGYGQGGQEQGGQGYGEQQGGGQEQGYGQGGGQEQGYGQEQGGQGYGEQQGGGQEQGYGQGGQEQGYGEQQGGSGGEQGY